MPSSKKRRRTYSSYDGNGNLLSDGNRSFAYDDENQLTSVWVTNGWRSDFVYDGKMRRRVRREYTWFSGAWLQTNEVHYIYDGNLVIQERDANNVPTLSYTRGRDLSGGLQGAGGIGGLLAMSQGSGASLQHSFYHADGNGNITALVNGKQAIVARYLYDPFGNILSKAGPLADANLYRFSSKEVHKFSGLVYYQRRFYDPSLGRWLTSDPIGERSDRNLYRFAANNPITQVDPLGLWNLWAPWTWGVPTGGGTTIWNSLNPLDSSAGWSGFSLETSSEADAAFLDGINPFGNPLANMGLYDPCDKALRASRHVGSATAITLGALGTFGTLGIVEGAAGGSSEAVLTAIDTLESAEAAAGKAEEAYLIAHGNLVMATETGIGEFIAIAEQSVADAELAVLNTGSKLQIAVEALEALGVRVGYLW